MNVTERIAHAIAETDFDHLSEEAITQSKRAILDTIGVTLAGHQDEAGQIITTWVQQHRTDTGAAILGTPILTSPALAALANGTLGHALDFDDVTTHMQGHPSVTVLPAVLSLGESLGVSGAEALTAFVLGVETEAKIGKTMSAALSRRGWHPTAVLGPFGAAAAASKFLGLSGSQIRMALGIAASKASGLRQNFGTMTKPLHAGEAARSGVEAAQWAHQGFTADADILASRLGFFMTLVGEGEFDPEVAPQDFGQPYEIVSPGIGVKPYPACRQVHRSIDAMLELVRTHRFQPEDIEEIICESSEETLNYLVHHRPRTGSEGRFSMEYCMAASIIHGQMGLAQFDDAAVQDERAQTLLQRVRYEHPDAGQPQWDTTLPDVITVVLRDGQRLLQRADVAKGDPALPLSWEELVDKFYDCATAVLPEAQAEAAVQQIAHLESQPSLQPLMAHLTCASPPSSTGI
ncbi:MmgE/PrpD family protein [Candidatus Entotheonella palauensis]|uniref:MmgE/PrpD family protein n=1 Tax=Candidatus Entotheonella palauensis TaxID=93172 RepID=UPI000B7FCD64|nr:MmgE/PrpD family protein [Candidatus Entotheonella palauensis]